MKILEEMVLQFLASYLHLISQTSVENSVANLSIPFLRFGTLHTTATDPLLLTL